MALNLKGRSKIVSEFTSKDLLIESNIIKLCDVTFPLHLQNKIAIDYLTDYKNGLQPILQKTKLVREEINNTLVVNHAQMTTRNIIGYFLGNPIQYITSKSGNKDDIDKLNMYVAYEGKCSVDQQIGEHQSICGTAYRLIFTDGVLEDEVPFEDRALDPSTTYVVYENNISGKPLAGITYHSILDEKNAPIGIKMYVYTVFGLYVLNNYNVGVGRQNTVNFSPYNIGGVPIIEYPNNMWRIGDWELCISLMDAINMLHSGRLDDIDQVIQSLLVITNADIDADAYEEMREQGVVMLKNSTGNPSKIDSISTPLDQSGMNLFANELEQLLYALLGIPDRNNRSGGGGDTGQAVELRDGWADLEIIARNKELVYKEAEKQTLKIIITILNNKEGTNLRLLDIDIKFTRNKANNLLVKTQGYMNLLATKTLHPADCLSIVDLVSDVNEYIGRGELFWGENFANNIVVKEEPSDSNDPVVDEGKEDE
jgi:SPP1 family phage portal protein